MSVWAGATWVWADNNEIKWSSTGYSSYCRIELFLKAQVVAGAMKDASGGGDSRMLSVVEGEGLEEMCLLANCTCPLQAPSSGMALY